MEIKLLPEVINERIRSNNKINDFCQCILELIFNSLDAKATSIAIRINTEKHQVQVVDNGNGISLSDLQNVGVRYMTSKCDSLYIYENKHKYYGYKGEALASILSASQKLIISTRHIEEEFTYAKTFENGSFESIVPAKIRSSKGTTVTIVGFFFNCPVKQKRIKNSVDLNYIKSTLKALTVIHPRVSLSLRDDSTGKILLNCLKTKTVSKSLCALYGNIVSEDLIEVKISKDNIHVSGLIYTKSYKNSKPQLVYVNKRPANVERIEKYVNEILSRTLKDIVAVDSYPVFIINISCPYSHIDILFDSFKIVVEFKSWEVIMKCVDKMLKLFISKYTKIQEHQVDLQDDILTNRDNLPQEIQSISKPTFEPNIEQNYVVDDDKTLKLELPNSKINNQKRLKKEIGINLLPQRKPYRKTLGLKKPQLKLKQKKRNIFEKSTNISDLSLSFHDIPSNMPLKRDKLKKNFNCLENIFDEQFDSQHLVFSHTNPCDENVVTKESQNGRCSQKVSFQNASINKDAILNDESTGKEFIMDLFLNSLTPHVQENILHKVRDKEESLIKEEIKKKLRNSSDLSHDENISGSSKLYLPNPPESIIESCKEHEITFNVEMIKKRRMEKLNYVGTSLINTKLSKLKRSNSDTKTLAGSALNNKISTSTSTSINEGAIILKRHKSEDKFTQTSFVREKEFNMTSASVQTSFYIDLSSKHNERPAEKQHYRTISSKFRTPNKNWFGKPFEPYIEDKSDGLNLETFKYDKINNVANNITFASHYNTTKLVEKIPGSQNSTIIQINTRDAIVSLNNTISKRIRQQEVNKNYHSFTEDLENSAAVLDNHPLNGSFELNFSSGRSNDESCKNISKFFANSPQINGEKKAVISVLIDTSTFLHRNSEKILNQGNQSDYFKRPQSSHDFKNELFSQTALSFRKFIPAFKSTQKQEKYCGKVYNFFESFMFNEYNEKRNMESNGDITFAPILCEDELRDSVSEKEWVGEVDNIGNNYFVNRRTGMAVHTLREESNFVFKKRVDFIPKGLSPILKEINTVNMSLGPSEKKELNNAIIESYENERDLIKWQDYINKEDPKQFFNNLYEEKRKNIEQIIPCISDISLTNIKKVYSSHYGYCFSKDIFNKLNILGQLDNKFIVTLSNSTLILLLDQHAVHERIRVEALLQDFTRQNINSDRIIFKSVKCNESLTIEFTDIKLQLLDAFKIHFESIGLHFKIYDNCLKITRIPLCFAKKYSSNGSSEENLYRMVSILIDDELSVLQSTRGIPSNIPKIMQYTINNQACRGAIKFGQKLTRNECVNYVNNLAKCHLPFQCAHGRPTLYPILELCDSGRDLKCHLNTLLRSI